MTRRRIKKRELDNQRIAGMAPVEPELAFVGEPAAAPVAEPDEPVLSETPVIDSEQATAPAKKSKKKSKKKSASGNRTKKS